MCKENVLFKYVSRQYSVDESIVFLIRLPDPFVLNYSYLDLFEVLLYVIIYRHVQNLQNVQRFSFS